MNQDEAIALRNTIERSGQAIGQAMVIRRANPANSYTMPWLYSVQAFIDSRWTEYADPREWDNRTANR